MRTHQVVAGSVKLRPTTGGGHNTGKTTTAVGVRFGYEMHDQYIFHYCAMFFPHYHREAFISTEFSLKFTMCFLGCLQYLVSLSPGDTDDTVYGESIPNSAHRYRYLKSAFPQPLPTLPMSKDAAFAYSPSSFLVRSPPQISTQAFPKTSVLAGQEHESVPSS